MHAIISDYKTELSDKIDELFANLVGTDGEYRSDSYRHIACNTLIEDYFAKSGEVPPSAMLDRLATYLIKDDNRRYKGVKHTVREYPYLSEKQYDRRTDKEASLAAAETYDSEGVNRQTLTRSLRIESELKTRKVK